MKRLRRVGCCLASILAGCTPQSVVRPAPLPLTSSLGATALPLAETPIQLENQGSTRLRSSQFYYGTGASIGPGSGADIGSVSLSGAYPDATGNGTTLNFTNADVRDVTKAVLGDLLKLNYEVDPAVQGTITVATASPVSRDAVLPIFEQSLLLAGLALVQQNNVYRIVPAADAPRQAGTPIVAQPGASLSPGFGLEIVPLRYVSASQMQTLLQPLVPNGSIISVDADRNILTIAGTVDQRRAILSDVALFDVDQLSGKSFALFRPQSVNAEDLAHGLQAIISGPEGQALGGVIRLIPLDRLNAVLVITSQAQYLPELQSWVLRLDQPSDSNQQELYVYRVQNGKAADLAQVLTNVFGNDASPASSNAGGAEASGTQEGSGSENPLLGPIQGQSGALQSSSLSSSTSVGSPLLSTSGTSLSGSNSNQPLADNAGDGSESESSDVNSFSTGGDTTAGVPGIRVTADNVNNALVIRCLPSQYAKILEALKQLDVQPLQVLIEASVAEVTLTNQLQYGVQYYFQNDHTSFIQTTSASQAISAALPGFAAIVQEGNSIPIILSALQALTTVTVLSAPELMVLNNQTASLQVGDEVPVATEQSQSTLISNAPIINSIQYQNTGVILKVTPHVNAGGLVTMDISQEVSDVSTTTTSTLNSPTISERLIASTVAIHDGQTVALGGLISDNRTNGKSGVPFLQNIPYLGALFSTTNHSVNRTELLVLLTPHVVGDQDQAQAVTDELRAKLIATLPAFSAGQ